MREYLGHGLFAELAHQLDVADRIELDEKGNEFDAVRGRDAERDKQLDSFIELSDAVASGLLILAGYPPPLPAGNRFATCGYQARLAPNADLPRSEFHSNWLILLDSN